MLDLTKILSYANGKLRYQAVAVLKQPGVAPQNDSNFKTHKNNKHKISFNIIRSVSLLTLEKHSVLLPTKSKVTLANRIKLH